MRVEVGMKAPFFPQTIFWMGPLDTLCTCIFRRNRGDNHCVIPIVPNPCPNRHLWYCLLNHRLLQHLSKSRTEYFTFNTSLLYLFFGRNLTFHVSQCESCISSAVRGKALAWLVWGAGQPPSQATKDTSVLAGGQADSDTLPKRPRPWPYLVSVLGSIRKFWPLIMMLNKVNL